MPGIEVVDRGAREIVVFLSGNLRDETPEQLHSAVEEVVTLERLNGLDHVVVNMHHVASLGDSGIAFLRELTERGRRDGFDVSFAAMSGPAHREAEAAGWSFIEESPPA